MVINILYGTPSHCAKPIRIIQEDLRNLVDAWLALGPTNSQEGISRYTEIYKHK